MEKFMKTKNYSNKYSIIFMSHTHCVHDLFRHVHSKYVTYLITK